MPPVSPVCDLPAGHPLRVVRKLIDHALDDVGGLVAAAEDSCTENLPRWVVRAVLLQALCGVQSDVDMAHRLNTDAGYRGFVGAFPEGAGMTAQDFAEVRCQVLGIAGFAAFLRILLAILERRGLLADAMFVPDVGLLHERVPAGNVLAVPS